ncbi:DUF2961 domain-containing protein [Bdellovibrionota bacterium FG-1]
MKRHLVWCVGMGLLGAVSVQAKSTVPPALQSLLRFHPGWVTRSVTSHDPSGGNGDGNGNGIKAEGDYQVLFHAKGEGRVTRLWMTAHWDEEVPKDWQELWIVIDGQTAYRGNPADYFAGRGPWQAPLVMDYQQSSGGYVSYVPFAFSHEAKILFKGIPHYFQVNYRQGAGSAEGPSASELSRLMSEHWWAATEAKPQQPLHVAPGGTVLAAGPVTVEDLSITIAPQDLSRLQIKIGEQKPVPLSFFFGLGSTGLEPLDGGWGDVTSIIHHVDAQTHRFSTRLPIPLQAGERLVIETRDHQDAAVQYQLAQTQALFPGVHLVAQYRDQMGSGLETTLPFFESQGPTQFVSLIEEITDGQKGSRQFLEGDEMIRTDRMSYPVQLGTGTEDYFNGGWYFLNGFSNPMSGLTRFVVNDPEDDWAHALYEHSLYRNHVADVIVSRGPMRFGFEAGDLGAYQPVRYRTLGLAYSFDRWSSSLRMDVALDRVTTLGRSSESLVSSAVDAERLQPIQNFRVRTGLGRSQFKVGCPTHQTPAGLFLMRTYDAARGDQEARLSVNGRAVGTLFEAYANSVRRFAQDGIWVDLLPLDCPKGANGVMTFELDSSHSAADWTEASYEVTWYNDTGAADEGTPLRQGDAFQILDTSSVDGGPHYVNDHSLVQGKDGRWHLYGIYHQEPFDPEHEFDFVHAASTQPTENLSADLSTMKLSVEGIVLTKDASIGEHHLWAPHIIQEGDRYLMAYQSGGIDNDQAQIRLATSSDLTHWARVGSEPLFTDICVARDPMIKKWGDLWTLYYTRCDDIHSRRSGVAYRTSLDLIHWSEPKMALVLSETPEMFNSGYTESPFVFEKDGWYYLSVTSYPIEWNATMVYRSRSPFSFPASLFSRLEAHAAEWLSDPDGGLWMTSAGTGQGGVWMAKVFR